MTPASDPIEDNRPMVLEETERSAMGNGLPQREPDGQPTSHEIYQRHKDRIYSIALRYSGDAAAAQDIAQDIFLKLFASIGNFRGESTFETWLFRLVVNCCFDYRRKTKRLAPLVEGVLDLMRAPGRSALEEVMRQETNGQVRMAVDTLPPEQRMVVVLRYTEGLSYDEIAEVMGCSAGTIASRLNRVHKVLERRLCRVIGNRLVGNKRNQHV
jgi:RNA polymerase sigma-70 factor (ECF subfamily)